MTNKQKELLKEIKEEACKGFDGMEEYIEELLDSYVCTCHFDNIITIVEEILKEEREDK